MVRLLAYLLLDVLAAFLGLGCHADAMTGYTPTPTFTPPTQSW